MILTVTPNPSIDLFFTAESALVWDDANRVAPPRMRAGGQGINLTRAARVLGGESVAVALLGGATGRELGALLEGEGTPLVPVEGPGETRIFVAVRESPSGRSLLVNPRGAPCEGAHADRLLAAVTAAIDRHRPAWVVSSGSVPPGLPLDFHARVGALARERGCRFVADCDGEALRSAATSGHCDLLAPNRYEARRLAGSDPTDPRAAADVARQLLAHAPIVAVKLGPAGAVAASVAGAWHARPLHEESGVAVGAGDAFLAAFLLALRADAPVHEALRNAVAAGAATLLSTGAAILDGTTFERLRGSVRLTDL